MLQQSTRGGGEEVCPSAIATMIQTQNGNHADGATNRRYQPRLVATNSSGIVNSHSGLAKWRMGVGGSGGDGGGGDGGGGDGVCPPGPILLI